MFKFKIFDKKMLDTAYYVIVLKMIILFIYFLISNIVSLYKDRIVFFYKDRILYKEIRYLYLQKESLRIYY